MLLRQTQFGPGLTPDSAGYVATGRNLFAGEGFVAVFGPFDGYAPFFSVVLAVTGLLRDDMIASAAALNAVAFGFSVSVTAIWLQRRQVSAFLVVWVGLALALSPLASMATYIWSESLFVLFTLVALFALDRFLVAGSHRALLLSAAAAALCCLTRYMGASVIACAVLLIALRSGWQPARRLRAVAVYAAVGLAPTALWLARNVLVVDSLMGDRSASQRDSIVGLTHMVVEMALAVAVGPGVFDWIEGFSDGGGTRDATIADLQWKLTWLLGFWALVVCGLACCRRAGSWREVSVPAGFLLCYFAVLAAGLPLGGLPAELRYVVPIIPPMLVVFALGFHMCHARVVGGLGLDGARGALGKCLSGAAMVVAAAWLAQWVAPNAAEIRHWQTHGGNGYGAKRWAESETVAHLKSYAFDGPLLSNDPIAVYLLLGGGTAAHLSGTHRVNGITSEIPPGVHVVWFYDPKERNLQILTTFLTAFPKMQLVAAHDDGILFRQGAKEDANDAATELLAESLLRSARRGQLVAASDFDLYLDDAGRRLTYVKHDCDPTDVRPRFFLHVHPQDRADLPSGTIWFGYDGEVPGWGVWRRFLVDFHNLDFSFAHRGVQANGVCIATKALPSYPIAEVDTGQWSPAGERWRARFVMPPRQRAHNLLERREPTPESSGRADNS